MGSLPVTGSPLTKPEAPVSPRRRGFSVALTCGENGSLIPSRRGSLARVFVSRKISRDFFQSLNYSHLRDAISQDNVSYT